MFRKVNAVVLFVQDLEKCMLFYRDVLGLEVVFSDSVSYAFKMEGQDFALVKRSAAVQMLNEEVVARHWSIAQQVMLCANVEDVDAVYKAYTAKSVPFINPPKDQEWGWRTAYLADPEGNLWEFRQSIPTAG
jgi:lactoylglutathione lyase